MFAEFNSEDYLILFVPRIFKSKDYSISFFRKIQLNDVIKEQGLILRS